MEDSALEEAAVEEEAVEGTAVEEAALEDSAFAMLRVDVCRGVIRDSCRRNACALSRGKIFTNLIRIH